MPHHWWVPLANRTPWGSQCAQHSQQWWASAQLFCHFDVFLFFWGGNLTSNSSQLAGFNFHRAEPSPQASGWSAGALLGLGTSQAGGALLEAVSLQLAWGFWRGPSLRCATGTSASTVTSVIYNQGIMRIPLVAASDQLVLLFSWLLDQVKHGKTKVSLKKDSFWAVR